jgi:dephospho-CoA kinase
MRVVSIVGMSGSGKSEAANVFRENGYFPVRFGDITDEAVINRGLELNEANEREVREELRREHGMEAYAVLSVPRIDAALKESSVVVDGLYSWEEYKYLKQRYGKDFIVVAVYASPRSRYARLAEREVRPLTAAESASRDHAEIENLDKGGPIAMADFTIINESSFEDMKKQAERIIASLR